MLRSICKGSQYRALCSALPPPCLSPAARFFSSPPSSSSSREEKALNIARSEADSPHFSQQPVKSKGKSLKPDSKLDLSHMLPHPIWSEESVENVGQTHYKPTSPADACAYASVKLLRFGFDFLSGYYFGTRDERFWLRRVIFLETVAGVPGMVGAMHRHLLSLRKMERDYGWIHTLLEEAENERMHLLIAMTLKKPGAVFRTGVLAAQFVFFSYYAVAYLLSPRYCHRFVGYLEEEAVRTYTKLLAEIDQRDLPLFHNHQAPFIARDYYQLPESATLRHVFACIRADESHHRDVNHTFASMDANEKNPFRPGH